MMLRNIKRLALVALMTFPFVAGASVPSSAATTFQKLQGTWSGWGWITLHSGGRERVRCKASYKISSSGNRMNQQLRCASTSYKINANSSLRSSGTRISGSWSESTFDVSGPVTGSSRSDGLSLQLSGSGFSAGMSVSVGKCKQSLSISASGIEIRKVSVGLRKC